MGLELQRTKQETANRDSDGYQPSRLRRGCGLDAAEVDDCVANAVLALHTFDLFVLNGLGVEITHDEITL
jgi:hypothetical protein